MSKKFKDGIVFLAFVSSGMAIIAGYSVLHQAEYNRIDEKLSGLHYLISNPPLERDQPQYRRHH